MEIKYDLYRTPMTKDNENKKRFHPRVVSKHTIDVEEMMEIIHSRCTLTSQDMKPTIDAFRKEIITQLKNGNRVHIDGLGYFSISLKAPESRTATSVRAESIEFKSLVFRAEKSVNEEFRTLTFSKSTQSHHSKEQSDTDIDTTLTEYFNHNEYITREQFQNLCCLTRSTAQRQLNILLEKKRLEKFGLLKSPLYRPVIGNYGWYSTR